MGVYSPGTEPHIDGWITSVRDDGTYVAEPLEPLTHYQLDKGCVDHIEAGSRHELVWLCRAALMHAVIVARAEQAADDAPSLRKIP